MKNRRRKIRIIVNQERTKIINFEKITEITASGTRILVGDDIFIPKGEEIAKYETEERAKKVLQEITEKICEGSNIMMDIEGISCEVSKQIYYMPER